MTHTCHSCPAPARWRDQHGRCWCVSHLPTNGSFRSLRRAEPDIVDELEAAGIGLIPALGDHLCQRAAAEIRRLRAALAGHASADGKQQQRHGREEGSAVQVRPRAL
jgi:hypothetical protein